MQSKDRRISVRLDDDRFHALERLASREGFSISVIVRHLVYRYIEQHQRLGAIRG